MDFTNSSESSVSIPATLSPAEQIACFSICNKIVKPNNTESLPYFRQPPQGAILNQGCQAFINKYRNDRDVYRPRPLDNLLRTCIETHPKILREADVVTWRGVIVNIMLGKKVDLNMSLIDGVLYLDEHDPAPYKSGVNASSYQGHVFETICTTSDPNARDDPPPPLNINLHNLWCSVFARKLGDLNSVMAAEVDCVRDTYTGNADCFLELKSRKINGPTAKHHLDSQILRKWYMQSYMVGTPTLFIGYHIDYILQSTQFLNTADIPALVAGGTWEPQTNIDWGCKVLTYLREFCENAPDKGERVRRVEVRSMSAGISVRALTQKEMTEVHKRGERRIGIVPARFVQVLRRK